MVKMHELKALLDEIGWEDGDGQYFNDKYCVDFFPLDFVIKGMKEIPFIRLPYKECTIFVNGDNLYIEYNNSSMTPYIRIDILEEE